MTSHNFDPKLTLPPPSVPIIIILLFPSIDGVPIDVALPNIVGCYYILKIQNLYIILLCTHWYHFFPVSIHYYQIWILLISPIKGISFLKIN